MFCKLALLLSVEFFVLIAAIFLLVYVTKQQVNKWFSYSSVAIIIAVLVMMISSVCCAVCCRGCGPHKIKKECRMEDRRCGKKMMIKMNEGHCSEGMMRDGDCCEEKTAFHKAEACEEKKECCKKDVKVIKEVIIDSLPKKEIIIKKK